MIVAAASGDAARSADGDRANEHLRRRDGELRHRTNNFLASLRALVKLSARTATDVPTFARELDARIAVLGAVHAIGLTQPSDADGAPVARVIADVLSVAAATSTAELDGPEVVLPTAHLAPFGLVVHELTSRSRGGDRSPIAIRWRIDATTAVFSWSAGGPVPPEASDWPESSRSLVRLCLDQLGATTDEAANEGDVRVSLRLPVFRDGQRQRVV